MSATVSTQELIAQVSDRLFYQKGYVNTSFADIANGVKISRGNLYHHYKSKDQILESVIALRIKNTQQMLDGWERVNQSPKERIACFIRILFVNQDKIKHYGCPVGGLTNELGKLHHPSMENAKAVFLLFTKWLTKQFEALGAAERAETLAMHLVSWSQGTATLYAAFQDEEFFKREVAHINRWLVDVLS